MNFHLHLNLNEQLNVMCRNQYTLLPAVQQFFDTNFAIAAFQGADALDADKFAAAAGF